MVDTETVHKIHSKSDVFFESISKGVRETILINFALDESPDSKFCVKPKQCRMKVNETVLNKFSSYLVDDDKRTVTFNGGTMTFASLLQNKNYKKSIKVLKLIHFVWEDAITLVL